MESILSSPGGSRTVAIAVSCLWQGIVLAYYIGTWKCLCGEFESCGSYPWGYWSFEDDFVSFSTFTAHGHIKPPLGHGERAKEEQ